MQFIFLCIILYSSSLVAEEASQDSLFHFQSRVGKTIQAAKAGSRDELAIDFIRQKFSGGSAESTWSFDPYPSPAQITSLKPRVRVNSPLSSGATSYTPRWEIFQKQDGSGVCQNLPISEFRINTNLAAADCPNGNPSPKRFEVDSSALSSIEQNPLSGQDQRGFIGVPQLDKLSDLDQNNLFSGVSFTVPSSSLELVPIKFLSFVPDNSQNPQSVIAVKVQAGTLVADVPVAESDSVTPPQKLSVLVASYELGCDSMPVVFVIDPSTGEAKKKFDPYPDSPGFRGGVRVAVGNIDRDPTTLEIITVPGPGRPTEVRVFDLNGVEKTSFRYFPFGGAYSYGAEIGLGDIDGDGIHDLVSGESRGPGRVNVTLSRGTLFESIPSKSFVAFGGTYLGGAKVAVGNVGEIVVGSGLSLSPQLKVYDVSGTVPKLLNEFAATMPGGWGGYERAGITLSTHFFSGADKREILVAGGRNMGSKIGVYSNNKTSPINTFNTFSHWQRGTLPIHSTAAALKGDLVDTIFVSQMDGPEPTTYPYYKILKVDAKTGIVDTSFKATLGGKPIIVPLRLATPR